MELNTNPDAPELLAGAGAVLAVVAAFLTWVAAGVDAGPVDVNAAVAGIDTVGVFSLLLGLAVLAVLLLVTADVQPIATAAGGLLIGLVAVWKYVDIGGAADPGLGLYLTVIAGLAVFAGGAWSYTDEGASPL